VCYALSVASNVATFQFISGAETPHLSADSCLFVHAAMFIFCVCLVLVHECIGVLLFLVSHL
jgi:hypothetical protein